MTVGRAQNGTVLSCHHRARLAAPGPALGDRIEDLALDCLAGLPDIAGLSAFGLVAPGESVAFLSAPKIWGADGSPRRPSALPGWLVDTLLAPDMLVSSLGHDASAVGHVWVFAGAGWHVLVRDHDRTLWRLAAGEPAPAERITARCAAENPFGDSATAWVRPGQTRHETLAHAASLDAARPVLERWLNREFSPHDVLPGATFRVSFELDL